MASADSASPKPVKTAAKAAEKPSETPADPKTAKAAAAAGKYAQAQALPDATLADDEGAEGDAVAASEGFKAWLQPGRRRWILLGTAVTSLMLLVAVTVVAASFRKAPPVEDTGSDVIAGLAQVIDGGTLVVAGQTLQLEAIDAPPASLMCRDGGYQYRCGDDARRALAVAIGDGPIECVHPHSQDGGRLAALCRNDLGLDVAAIQVESGWAVNDLKKSSRYIAEELRARNNGKGLWRNDFAHPELWRGASR